VILGFCELVLLINVSKQKAGCHEKRCQHPRRFLVELILFGVQSCQLELHGSSAGVTQEHCASRVQKQERSGLVDPMRWPTTSIFQAAVRYCFFRSPYSIRGIAFEPRHFIFSFTKNYLPVRQIDRCIRIRNDLLYLNLRASVHHCSLFTFRSLHDAN